MSATLDYLKIIDIESAMASCINKEIKIAFVDEMRGVYSPLKAVLKERELVSIQYLEGSGISEENKKLLILRFMHINAIICSTLGIPTNCF